MEPKRIFIKEELAKLGYPEYEKYIFKHSYLEAEKKRIELDWNGLFLNWYYAQAFRIINNIKKFPEVFMSLNPEELMELKDTDINEELQKYQHNIKKKQKAINMDYTCQKCKNQGVYIEKKQLRSLDEGKTSIFTCVKCQFNWREN